VSRYYQRGIQVFDTSKTGALIFNFPPDDTFDIRAYRKDSRRYWRYLPDSLWPPAM